MFEFLKAISAKPPVSVRERVLALRALGRCR